jgi:hypothetical protein
VQRFVFCSGSQIFTKVPNSDFSQCPLKSRLSDIKMRTHLCSKKEAFTTFS